MLMEGTKPLTALNDQRYESQESWVEREAPRRVGGKARGNAELVRRVAGADGGEDVEEEECDTVAKTGQRESKL